jgi:hypothetical protein
MINSTASSSMKRRKFQINVDVDLAIKRYKNATSKSQALTQTSQSNALNEETNLVSNASAIHSENSESGVLKGVLKGSQTISSHKGHEDSASVSDRRVRFASDDSSPNDNISDDGSNLSGDNSDQSGDGSSLSDHGSHLVPVTCVDKVTSRRSLWTTFGAKDLVIYDAGGAAELNVLCNETFKMWCEESKVMLEFRNFCQEHELSASQFIQSKVRCPYLFTVVSSF